MGTAERKAREKEELKALILSAAKKLFIENGIERTTIRNIADEIDYSVGTVYVYYKDKNAILYDINSAGFHLLREQMIAGLTVEDPMEQLRTVAKIYIRFAIENKELYDLMFIMKAPMEYLSCEDDSEREWCEGEAAFSFLMNAVEKCQATGFFKNQDIESVALLLWAEVHGLCSLYVKGGCVYI